MTCGAGLTLLGRGGRELENVGSSTCALDPLWGSVALLLHFEGANNSTVFTDNSPLGLTGTRVAPAKISTVSPITDTASGSLGSNGTVSFTHPNFNTGTGDLTLELKFRYTASGGNSRSVFTTTGGPDWWTVLLTGTDTLRFVGPGYRESTVLTVGTTYSMALVRHLGTWYLYLDGVLQGGSGLGDATSYANTGCVLGYSGFFTTFSIDCPIDELRYTPGEARYLTAYTPETLPFCNDASEPVGVTPPPTTVPPDGLTDAYWSSVLFLSAMDLTKVNDKTSVAYTLDSAAVTATDPFDGAGALACVYPPSAPTSTPFDPASSMTFAYTSTGLTVEFWLRVDSWAAWTSGAHKWANLFQVDNPFDADAPYFSLALVDEVVDGETVPCFQMYGYHLRVSNYYFNYTRVKQGLRASVDGAWHHVRVVFRYYAPFARWNASLSVDGSLQASLLATPGSPRFSGVVVPPNKEGQGPIGFVYTAPFAPAIIPTTFAGAVDEIRITAADRGDGPFVVPHYAFPRS